MKLSVDRILGAPDLDTFLEQAKRKKAKADVEHRLRKEAQESKMAKLKEIGRLGLPPDQATLASLRFVGPFGVQEANALFRNALNDAGILHGAVDILRQQGFHIEETTIKRYCPSIRRFEEVFAYRLVCD